MTRTTKARAWIASLDILGWLMIALTVGVLCIEGMSIGVLIWRAATNG